MKIKSVIIYLIVHLQSYPFKELFALMYWLAVKVTVFSIRSVSGVSAIYLTGSFARGDLLYGLSDIDFKIFLRGPKDSFRYDRIKQVFKWLRYVFPMLGPADEKGIYFEDGFIDDYKRYPLIQHLFDERYYGNTLLWGDDVIRQFSLKSPSNHKVYLSYIWKFKDWMEKLLNYYLSEDMSEIQKQYLFYKGISDVGLIYLRMHNPAYLFKGRKELLKDLKEKVDGEKAILINQLLLERRLIFTKQIADPEEKFSLFKILMTQCISLMVHQGEKEKIKMKLTEHRNIDSKADKNIDKIKAIFHSEIDVITLPTTHIPVSPLDCEYFGCPSYVICSNRFVTLEELRELQALYKSKLVDKAVLYIKDNDHFVYSVFSEIMEYWVKVPFTDPFLFALLEICPANEFDLWYTDLVKDKLYQNILQLETILKCRGIYKIHPKTYVKFFFMAIRNAILYRSLLNYKKYVFPINVEGVVDYLKDNTPLSPEFIDLLVSEYKNVLEDNESYFEAFFGKSMVSLETFVEIIKENESFDNLSFLNGLKDLKSLSISVVVVTRTRCEQLRRCLYSLTELKRRPDEIIVVDNNSTDNTKEVVNSFNTLLPIKYVYEPRVGIPIARNAGVKVASGDIIAFTDDDAVVDRLWLTYIEKAFLKDPKIGVVGGSIHNLKSNRNDLINEYFSIATEI